MIRVQEFLRNLAPILLICFPFILPAQVSNPVADLAINAYNDAFLTTSNGRTYYKRALDDNSHDGTWTLALDIQGMQDAYERTGDPVHKEIINDLCRSFLLFNPTPYSWDGWNDDLAWMALVLVRGYQMTGVENFLTEAESTFNLAFDRGWNTHFNDGGIWEQQPDFVGEDAATNKEALSNNPMGQLACMLYQSTGNEYYLDKAKQIYEWSWSHLFNPANGQVYAGVYRNEYINKGTAVYNQGTFIDFATLLYELTGDKRILRDARMSADFTIKHFTTNGILSNTAGYLNTWAAEFARGLGHLCKANPQLWDIYYPFLKENADAGWSNRRKDLNLTWNGWDQPTPEDPAGIPTKYVSLVSLLQFTPTIQSIPGTIKAEDYNYMNGMEVQDIGAGAKAISAAGADEWVEYIIDVPAEG
jgi:predicted alpha-1,6-mannanase (GH76 family)